ncbi:MAG TPA: TRAP transporter large permease [Minicystis sp.]|nr:TRAP transporter large permease [Minicystis sp.]
MAALLFLLVALLALLGAPLFAVMGGASELAWLTHANPNHHFLRFIAPNVLEERFADSPILVTIPLFTFIGYLMAESKAPDRIVRAASAALGWLPGGLAMVCIGASAFFTMLTGGSGVTIVAIGGLLYPTLRKQGYPSDYSLGLVTTGGSLGLLFPSLPVIVYAVVAGIDIRSAFKAGILPGLLIMALLGVHAAAIGTKHKVPRAPFDLDEFLVSLWDLKWEIGIPAILVAGIVLTHLTSLDECAAVAALYTLIVECFIHKDLDIKKDLTRVTKNSMVLAGAIILILAMANALINFVVNEKIPGRILDAMIGLGLTERWQFLVVLNVFLLVLGMLMEGFSAILVAVPLILPFAARFNLQPFHLAVMFLLNLEIAYCAPPLGLNLFISSFRFERPVISLYKVVLPFTGILAAGLFLVMYVPSISTVLVDGDIRAAYAQAEKVKEAPRDAWLLQCVQEDRSNPVPCTDADKKRWGPDGTLNPYAPPPAPNQPAAAATAEPETDRQMNDDLFKQMMGDAPAGSPSGSASAAPAAPPKSDKDMNDELFKEMMK